MSRLNTAWAGTGALAGTRSRPSTGALRVSVLRSHPTGVVLDYRRGHTRPTGVGRRGRRDRSGIGDRSTACSGGGAAGEFRRGQDRGIAADTTWGTGNCGGRRRRTSASRCTGSTGDHAGGPGRRIDGRRPGDAGCAGRRGSTALNHRRAGGSGRAARRGRGARE